MKHDFITYIIYITRWVVLAIPGAMFLQATKKLLARIGEDNITIAMLISQGILGALVYFIDRWIFGR